MRQSVLPVEGSVTVQVDQVGGDLQIVGWDRLEIIAKTDDDELSLTSAGQTIHAHSDGDLILYLAREVNLRIMDVDGDVDLRAISGSTDIRNIGGDLQMRNVGSVAIKSVSGDLSLRGSSGDLQVDMVGGDASLHDVQGDVSITVSADLYLRGAEKNVLARVGSDAALYLKPKPGANVNVQAGSDILLRLPAKVDVELSLQGCDDESIRVDLAGMRPVEMGNFRKLVVGAGGASINLQAGADVIVTSRGDEWENKAEFDSLGREGPFAPGEFPGLPSKLHEQILRRVEDATRRALEASMRAQEQSQQVQERVESAMRRADDKMRTAERRSMHMGIKIGRFGASIVGAARPPIEPVSPSTSGAMPEPVTDAERLVILKMLQDKKVSLQEAEKLLAALDGK